jgi:hypothetical protein
MSRHRGFFFSLRKSNIFVPLLSVLTILLWLCCAVASARRRATYYRAPYRAGQSLRHGAVRKCTAEYVYGNKSRTSIHWRTLKTLYSALTQQGSLVRSQYHPPLPPFQLVPLFLLPVRGSRNRTLCKVCQHIVRIARYSTRLPSALKPSAYGGGFDIGIRIVAWHLLFPWLWLS